MPSPVVCPACEHENRPEDRFCLSCGRALAANQPCKACGAALAVGAVFCTNCGARVQESEVPAGPGIVSGGIWDKADGELVRRVTLREMSGRFDRALRDEGLADAAGGGFWGFLFQTGKQAVEQLQNLHIQVPTGSIAVVMLDGQVTEILPPGRQTTLSFFKDILESVRASDDSDRSLWQRAWSAFTYETKTSAGSALPRPMPMPMWPKSGLRRRGPSRGGGLVGSQPSKSGMNGTAGCGGRADAPSREGPG